MAARQQSPTAATPSRAATGQPRRPRRPLLSHPATPRLNILARPFTTAHCPLPTPHSTSLASSACVSPPARVSPAHVARAPCTASADVPTRLPLRVHVPGSHSVRFCSCVANKPSLPHTGGPFLEPRGAQAGLKLSLRLNSPGPCTAPSSRHRLRCPADCRLQTADGPAKPPPTRTCSSSSAAAPYLPSPRGFDAAGARPAPALPSRATTPVQRPWSLGQVPSRLLATAPLPSGKLR